MLKRMKRKTFINRPEIQDSFKNAKILYLWKKRGIICEYHEKD